MASCILIAIGSDLWSPLMPQIPAPDLLEGIHCVHYRHAYIYMHRHICLQVSRAVSPDQAYALTSNCIELWQVLHILNALQQPEVGPKTLAEKILQPTLPESHIWVSSAMDVVAQSGNHGKRNQAQSRESS